MFAYVLQQSGLRDTLTLRELKHSARRKLGDVSSAEADRQIMESMIMLEQANWVVMNDADPRHNTYAWVINPRLPILYKEQREMVIRIKQTRLDDSWKKTNGKSERRFIPGYDAKTMDEIAVTNS